MARGRPQVPYRPSYGGEPVSGLYRLPDGRWRVTATGQRFTEPDERLAIKKFKSMVAEKVVFEGEPLEVKQPQGDPITWSVDEIQTFSDNLARYGKVELDAQVVWDYFRDQLLTNPHYAAQRTGLPELAHWQNLPVPQSPMSLSGIVETYKKHNRKASDKGKREAVQAFEKMQKFLNATTLADLTHSKLLEYRDHIEASIKGPATRQAYYGRAKSVIAFSLKRAENKSQLREALDRCGVLATDAEMPEDNPKPISRDHFHKLLGKANPAWRAMLITALNLCMSIDEVCGLKWEKLDLKAGTFAAYRNKTKIVRAAVLWPETLKELANLPRKSPFVFVSTHGTRYNRNTRVNDFVTLRTAASLPSEWTFSTIRDGAYTAATRGTGQTAASSPLVLAGHRAVGHQDKYVLRNPEFAKPACDAVYQVYGPF